jgi:hypothetical protein
MADYHPLILRAVAGLEHNTGENRRALYERARTALINQLRSVDPPLDESDITQERLALEEAIRKVEAETSKRLRPNEDAAASKRAQPNEEASRPAQSNEEVRASEEPSANLRNKGLRGFRDTMAEAEHLGGAAAQANRSAREVYEAVPGKPRTRTAGPARPNFEPPGSKPLPPVTEPELTDEMPPPPPQWPQPLSEDVPPPPAFDTHADYGRRVFDWGRIVKLTLLGLVIVGLLGVGYWERRPIYGMLASLHRTAPKKQEAAAPAGQPKITDRVGEAAGASKTATAPAAAVAQKVVLFEEDPNNPKGKRYVGSAIWRTETVSPGSGLAPELAVRADVEIPERHMRMTWSLRRNTDKALPASHTIEIQFTLPADFDQGGISNVPGVLMKAGEEGRGIPLAGLSVKVTDGYFLIGLSAVDIDKQRNIEMLKNRDWMDIPIVYTNGKRAILAIEKGTPGQRAFDEAFRAWGE